MSLLHQRGLVHGPDPAIHVLLCVRTEEICPHPAVFCLWANHRVLIVNVGAHSRVGRLWKTQIKSREDGDKKNILKDCKTTPWCWQSWYWQHINPVNCSLSYWSPQKQCFKKLQSKQAFEAVSAAVTGSWKGEGRRQVTHTHTHRQQHTLDIRWVTVMRLNTLIQKQENSWTDLHSNDIPRVYQCWR